jgi:hypothetical protein
VHPWLRKAEPSTVSGHSSPATSWQTSELSCLIWNASFTGHMFVGAQEAGNVARKSNNTWRCLRLRSGCAANEEFEKDNSRCTSILTLLRRIVERGI